MNAAQAVGNVAAESALANANPKLYGQTVQKAPNGKPLTIKKNERMAQEMGLLDKQGKPTKGVKINADGEIRNAILNLVTKPY